MKLELTEEDISIVCRALSERISSLSGKDPRLGFDEARRKVIEVERKIQEQVTAGV